MNQAPARTSFWMRSGVLLAVLLPLVLTGCVIRSGRLDPFPARTDPLRPDAPAVGILRFVDTRENPDRTSHAARSLPPPRVLLEEAMLAALQRRRVNGLIMTSPPGLQRDALASLARDMDLDAVLTGRVRKCEETLKGEWPFQSPKIEATCLFKLTLYDRNGEIIYSGTGLGHQRERPGWRGPTLDEFHRPMDRAMEKAVSQAAGDAFFDALKKSTGAAKASAP
jgi:hypothetical protein